VFLATGREPGRTGSAHPYLAPFQAFPTRDAWIYVAVWIERLWKPFCAAIGQPGLADDPRFVSTAERVRHRATLTARLEPIFRTRTLAEWMAALEAHDVLCAPVNRYADLADDPQIRASGMILEDRHPRAGAFRTLGPAVTFAATPGTLRTPAPALGEHTDAGLGELGLGPDEIGALRAAGIAA